MADLETSPPCPLGRPAPAAGRIQLPEFRPVPLLANNHVQTMWPFLFRRVPRFPVTTEAWPLPDGERLAVHLVERAGDRPGVLVLHGLESSAEAQYVRGLLGRARAAGWNGAAFDFRSCGARPLPTRVAYHAGKTDDLSFVVDGLRRRWGRAPLAVVGFSLGGSVLVRWLGELGEAAPVDTAVAVSVPFDLTCCATAVDSPGFWNAAYRKSFLLSLRRKALAMARREPGRFDLRAVRGVRSFADFDNHVTARLFGFRDAADYWNRCSAAVFVAAVRRPTLLIAAEDDPIVPAAAIPREQIARNPALTLWLTRQGGHLGFVAGSLWRPAYAAEEVAMAFLTARFAPG
jgi:predicted alpha/beta-fold hydrolase